VDPLVVRKVVNQRRLAQEITALPNISVPDTTNPILPTARRLLVSVTVNPLDQTVVAHPTEDTPQAVMDAVAAAIAAHDGTPDPVPDTPDFSTNVPDNFALQIANQFRVVSDYIALPATQAAQATAFVPAIKAIGRLTLWLVRKNWTNGH